MLEMQTDITDIYDGAWKNIYIFRNVIIHGEAVFKTRDMAARAAFLAEQADEAHRIRRQREGIRLCGTEKGVRFYWDEYVCSMQMPVGGGL